MKMVPALRALLFCACLTLASITTAQINVTTYHYDSSRMGQNTKETILTPSNVNSTKFGKLFSVTVDGQVYAQPLYLANVSIGGGTHNVVFVATEHDSLYAIDANVGTMYWHISLIPAGGSTVPSSALACSDIAPEVGITSTPVIDTGTHTIYVVTKAKVNGIYVQHLHAIDVVTHAEKFGGPRLIQASGFDAFRENNRPGLVLENGHVIIAWASLCDVTPYHGWIISYKASTLAREAVYNSTPNGGEGGVWQSGAAGAVDSNGNIYFATGNGSFNSTQKNFGNTILKLGPPSAGIFPLVDWFTPHNQSSLNGGDTDLGSGGVLLLPDLPAGSAHQHLLVQAGKEGTIYLIDRSQMGHYCSGCTRDSQIVQEISTGHSIFGAPAFWNNKVYFWGKGDVLKAYSFNANGSGLLSSSPIAKSTISYLFPGATPTISANGNTNGIVWSLDTSGAEANSPAVLRAHNASNVAIEIYNSKQAANGRDNPGGAVKFSVPVVANGKVYVGGKGRLTVYGLLATVATPTFSPAPGTYSGTRTVTLSDATSGATVHCTTNGTTPTSASPVCTTLTVSATKTIKAIGMKSGFVTSAVAVGTYTIQ